MTNTWRQLGDVTPDVFLGWVEHPPIEVRNAAAMQHAAMTASEDDLSRAEDEEMDQRTLDGLNAAIDALRRNYEDICAEHGFQLLTDASGLFLRCAETGIPLVIGDEYDELETGECVLVKRAA
jgi:hypothetical protein